MTIPRINQVPIQQPMYINGQLHQVWINFFEKLGLVADSNGFYSLSEMFKALEADQSEIKTLGTNITELQNHVTDLQKHIQSQDQTITDLKSQLETQKTATDTLSNQYRDLEKRVKKLENDKNKT